ncbi:hypothetical protein [Sphingomonas sp.]|uniref:hypothetical protein n=1 Tax=Sphingomonas sp. TaxID=28214 RepID=UPI002EDA2C8C
MFEYYADFVDSLGQNLEGHSTAESHASFARETNNMNLFASPEVISAMNAYRRQISVANTDRAYSDDDILLTALIKAMRVDRGVPHSERLGDASIKLWAPGPASARRKSVVRPS